MLIMLMVPTVSIAGLSFGGTALQAGPFVVFVVVGQN